VGVAVRTIALGIMPITAIIGINIATHTGTHVTILVWASLALGNIPVVRASSLDRF